MYPTRKLNIRRCKGKAILLCAGSLLLSGVAVSTSVAATAKSAIARADELEKEQNFITMIGTLEPYADTNDGEVEIRLATAYLNIGIDGHKPGDTDNEDMRRSLDFAQRAAEHGQAGAFNLLYQFYGNGWIVPADNAKALEYLKRGAQGGDLGAKLNYGINLYTGSPIAKRDLGAACKLFHDLAKDPGAQPIAAYYVGLTIFRGQCGYQADRKRAVRMFEIAANHGVRDAERDMGKNFEFGWTGPVDISKALDWYQKSADHGDPDSEWRVGMAYINGELGPKDSARGVRFLERSANSDYGKALVDLGVMYVTGDGVSKDFNKAITLYEKGAALGEPHAFRELATMYANGEGVDTDLVRARVMYLQSVEMGEAELSSMRKGIEEKLTASQMKESDTQFEAWRQAHSQ